MENSDRPVRTWQLALPLGESGATPLFARIARALSDDIRRGRLKPGQRLPGTRTLAESLAVHRNTVVAAFAELEAEGWIETRPARGAFVSGALPEAPPRRFARAVALAARPGYDLGPARGSCESPLPPGTLSMAGGIPDVRLAPAAELGRALRRALVRDRRRVLSYGHELGHPRLRAAIAEMLASTRGLAVGADDVLVTRGSQMALYLIAQALLEPGDVVGVEELGYRPAWEAFRTRGVELAPLGVGASGLDIESLSALCARRRVRAVYVTPHHQYPTLATMAAPRRLALLELARRHRFAVIEDDYDHEFHYEGRPVLPLASADAAGVVITVGTLSKIFAPGLRVGWVVAPPPVVGTLAGLRAHLDGQGDLPLEAALAELMEDGVVQRHARRARRIYQARRDYLVAALGRRLSDQLAFQVPSGGMALWARVRGVNADAWSEAALARGLSVRSARHFALDGRSRPYLRLGYASLNERELAEAVRRLWVARPARQR